MWSATDGARPVCRCTWAASATFSNGSRGTPACGKTLNRVPELPNAHDGSSMRCARSVARAVAAGVAIVSIRPSLLPQDTQHDTAVEGGCHDFRLVSICLLTL